MRVCVVEFFENLPKTVQITSWNKILFHEIIWTVFDRPTPLIRSTTLKRPTPLWIFWECKALIYMFIVSFTNLGWGLSYRTFTFTAPKSIICFFMDCVTVKFTSEDHVKFRTYCLIVQLSNQSHSDLWLHVKTVYLNTKFGAFFVPLDVVITAMHRRKITKRLRITWKPGQNFFI